MRAARAVFMAVSSLGSAIRERRSSPMTLPAAVADTVRERSPDTARRQSRGRLVAVLALLTGAGVALAIVLAATSAGQRHGRTAAAHPRHTTPALKAHATVASRAMRSSPPAPQS